GGGEVNTTNDTATDVTPITQFADLTVTKTHSGNFTEAQTGAAYTITVSNVGLGATVGTVMIADTLPPALCAPAITGTAWNCTLSTLSCSRGDVLGAGLSYPPLTVTVNIATNAAA